MPISVIPNPGKIRDTFLKAAEYIELHGWTQGTYKNASGEVCTAGALERVCAIDGSGYYPQENMDLYYATMDHFRRTVGVNAITWNDRLRRTKKQVLKLLRDLAADIPVEGV